METWFSHYNWDMRNPLLSQTNDFPLFPFPKIDITKYWQHRKCNYTSWRRPTYIRRAPNSVWADVTITFCWLRLKNIVFCDGERSSLYKNQDNLWFLLSTEKCNLFFTYGRKSARKKIKNENFHFGPKVRDSISP